MLDRDDPVVADRVESAQEAVPTHLAEAGQARHLPSLAERHHALLVEPVAIDLHVLGVHVEDARPELADRARVVDELPDEVGGVEVQAEVLVGDDLEHPAPHRGGVGEVAAAGPLVLGEDHRAVLDRDPHVALAREADDRRPHQLEFFEVLAHRAMLVAADERADDAHLEPLRGFDHPAQVVVGCLPRLGVRIEVVGVVRERGDLEVEARQQSPHRLRVEVLDVDVAHACVAPPLTAARWPARDLQRLEAALVRPARDLLQAQVREGGGEQAELHVPALTARSTSTQRCCRELCATASRTSISSWPSAKVG